MLLSLLGSSLLNNGFSWDTVKSLGVGMVGNLGNAIPGLLGSIGQTGKRVPSYNTMGLERSLHDTNRRIAEVGITNKTKNLLQKARAAQGTISAYLAGRGFAQGGSTATILSDINYNNVMSDIEISTLDSEQRIMESEIKQLQGTYSMMNNFEASYFAYESPMKKFIKESFVQPMIKQNLQELGGKINSAINSKFKESAQEEPFVRATREPLISNSFMQDQQLAEDFFDSNGSFVQPLISRSWVK